MSRKIVRRYTNGEVTVVWKPDRCIHSANCFRGLPEVFNPLKRPWVRVTGAPSAAIVEQVARCPSGALSSFRNADATGDGAAAESKSRQ